MTQERPPVLPPNLSQEQAKLNLIAEEMKQLQRLNYSDEQTFEIINRLKERLFGHGERK
jgi:hypothetical protein